MYMFSQIYAKRVEKWENIVVESLLSSFKNEGWENVYMSELTHYDEKKNIQIIHLHMIYSMARDMINGKVINYTIKTQKTIRSVKGNTITVYDSHTKKTTTYTISHDDDLIFVKEAVTKSSDPLKTWCQQFLKEYAQNDSVNDSIDKIPSYKPTQSQLQKLQRKREKDLLTWGSQF